MAYRRYLTQTGLLIATGLLALGLSLAFLWQAGELDAADSVANRQTDAGPDFLYGSALNQNTLAYKLALVNAVKPAVLIAGSSRTMQFRHWNFSGKTLTAGGAGSSIEEVSFFLDQALKGHTPQVIIIGVDFWWFHPDYRAEPPVLTQGDRVTKDKLLWVFREWRKQKIQGAEVMNILHSPAQDRAGLSAHLHQEGFRADGSWQYNLRWRTGKTGPNDLKHFRDTLQRIEKGNNQFLYGRHADPQRMQQFTAMIRKLQARRIPVILFMAPLAKPVLDAMSRRPQDYLYLIDVLSAAAVWGAPFLNLTDPARVAAHDCEFIDGFHGGDIVYARIARQLAGISGGALQTTAINDRNALLKNRPSVDDLAVCPSDTPLPPSASLKPGDNHAPSS